jgi:pSer/pThr/pTyr-binding forkhead associated (FHA) protein
VIGRDEACDLVLADMGVSRRHASISPVRGGYLLRDESANGTVVNGTRISGTFLLDHGDVLLIHQEELRFELHGHESSRPPVQSAASEAPATAILDLSHVTGSPEIVAARARTRPTSASLEVVDGQFAGASFQVDKPVCSIGRGPENDVRIRDVTISASHATLLRKGTTWYVVDLRSANGTFVNGSRVAGEREIRSGAAIRLGAVEVVFRVHDAAADGAASEERSAKKRGWVSRLLGRG